MTHPSFTHAASPARAHAAVRTAALVKGYRDWLSLYWLALLLAALDQAARLRDAEGMADLDLPPEPPTTKQPLRGPQTPRADKLVERGATAPLGGNLVQATDPRSQVTTLAYGYGGVLKSRQNAAGTVGYERNALGQVTLAQSPEVGYSYVYDAAGRLTTLWDSQDSYIAYVYDQGARLKQKWLANGVTAEYAWNPDNTLKQLKNSAYDFNSTTYATFTQHDVTYDNLGRKQTVTDKVGAFAQPPQTYAYGYDILGNRVTKTDGYDDQGRRIRKTSNGGAIRCQARIDLLAARSLHEPAGWGNSA